MAVRQINIYVNVVTRKLVNEGTLNGDLPFNDLPGVYFYEDVVFCAHLLDNDGNPYSVNPSDRFVAVIDNNYDHEDNVMGLSENINVNNPLHWNEVDPLNGKISFKFSLNNVGYKTKIGNNSNINAYLEILNYSDGNMGVLLQNPIFCYNLVGYNNSVPLEFVNFYTKDDINASFLNQNLEFNNYVNTPLLDGSIIGFSSFMNVITSGEHYLDTIHQDDESNSDSELNSTTNLMILTCTDYLILRNNGNIKTTDGQNYLLRNGCFCVLVNNNGFWKVMENRVSCKKVEIGDSLSNVITLSIDKLANTVINNDEVDVIYNIPAYDFNYSIKFVNLGNVIGLDCSALNLLGVLNVDNLFIIENKGDFITLDMIDGKCIVDGKNVKQISHVGKVFTVRCFDNALSIVDEIDSYTSMYDGKGNICFKEGLPMPVAFKHLKFIGVNDIVSDYGSTTPGGIALTIHSSLNGVQNDVKTMLYRQDESNGVWELTTPLNLDRITKVVATINE